MNSSEASIINDIILLQLCPSHEALLKLGVDFDRYQYSLSLQTRYAIQSLRYNNYVQRLYYELSRIRDTSTKQKVQTMLASLTAEINGTSQ